MRVSVEKDDSGYVYNPDNIKVYLDGIEQKHCLTADSTTGYIKRYVVDAKGRFTVNHDINVSVEEVYGDVTIELPKDGRVWWASDF